MKKHLILFTVLFSLVGYAQKDSTTNFIDKSSAFLQLEQGKSLLNENNYLKALLTFRNAGQKDPNSWRPPFWLAKTHYELKNFGYSLRYANTALSLDSVDINKEVYYVLAESYHRLGNLDSALYFYDKCLTNFTKKNSTVFEIQEKYDQVIFAQNAEKQEKFAERKALDRPINSGHNDYAPVLSYDGKTLYFTSRRNNTTGGGQNPYDELFYEDIYMAKWDDEDQVWDSLTNEGLLKRVNKNGFESLSWLSQDGQTAYLTINNEAVDERIETRSSDIFEMKLNNKGDWGTPKAAITDQINSSGFDAGATITADGSVLYFVSDRNLKNGSDIYMAERTGKKWGKPILLSDSINTTGNETTPFITPDGKYLFFSSDGHPGMGGYDIYVSKNLGGRNNWSKPINLGPAINSVNNDTHFQYYPHLKKALFASQVISGMKSDFDIFEIDMTNFDLLK